MSTRCLFVILLGPLAAITACGLRLPHIEKAPVAAEEVAKANAAAREGDILLGKGEAYAALLKYLEATKLHPYSDVMYNKLAITYTKLNFYDRALDSVARSLALNREYAYAYNTLGIIRLMQRKTGASIRSLRKATSLAPGVAFFHLNLASAYMQENDAEKAMNALRKALAIDPEVMSRQGGVGVQSTSVSFSGSGHFYMLAQLYAERGEEKMALDFLKKASSAGFTDFDRLRKDRAFEKLQQTEEFLDLLAEVKRNAEQERQGQQARPGPGLR